MVSEYEFRVGTRDIDPFNCCRASALLGFLQEAATEAARALHLEREHVAEKYNVFWMLARIWYKLEKPLRWGDAITIRTSHRGGKGASMYRDYDLFVDGEQVGEAVSIWVLADLETHGIHRLSSVTECLGTEGGAHSKTMLLPKLHMPQTLAPVGTRGMYYSDTDINAHVNNAKYADFACDALRMETRGNGHFITELQIGFLQESRPGDTLAMAVSEESGTFFVQGCGEDGKSKFDAAVTILAE